jgi:2-polyprenyl-3-methyl-5-hydroxy-6-metoxy-1,4-benzoquinol methylase
VTPFERIYHLTRRFDHPLYQHVYRLLARVQASADAPLRVLDVGGRRSNYTIGLRSRVTISDVPREREIQRQLDLGATDDMRRAVLARRSNIEDYVFDDMTHTGLPAKSFDVVVAVEVLEHVEEDATFVQNVSRLLKPGGVFVMTTPNGDFLATPYPDHKRHYRRDQLFNLLAAPFGATNVTVDYIVNAGRLLRWGVQRPSLRAPARTAVSIPALFLAAGLERTGIGGRGPSGKRHLLATATRPHE